MALRFSLSKPRTIHLGPDDAFKMNGYLEFEIYAGLTASTIISHGFKEVAFKDGGKIRWN